MCHELNIFYLIFIKNLMTCKRHFINSVINAILPGCLIAGILYIRSNLDVEPIHITDPTYFPILTKNDLIDEVPRSMLHLYYKPQNTFTEKLILNATRCMTLPRSQLHGFDSEVAMLQSYEKQQAEDSLITVLAIDFGNTIMSTNLSEYVPKELSYTIRSSDPIPNKLFDFDSKGYSVASDDLIQKIPIVTLQMCLDDAFVDKAAPAGAIKPTVVIQKMLYPPYDYPNPTEVSIQKIICLAGGLIYLSTIYLIPMYIAGEKSTGVNTLLKMNGVKSYTNFLSWLIIGAFFSIISVSVITISFKLSFTSGQKPFYDHSNWLIIWLVLFSNFIHIYAYCLHVASYFSKAWLAQLVAATLCVLINLTADQLQQNHLFGFIPYLGCIFPTVASMKIFDELNNRENQLTGVKWDNVFEATNPALPTCGSLGLIWFWSLLGIFVHICLALYFDAVLPSKYGIQKPPLLFWQCTKENKVSANKASDMQKDQPEVLEPVAKGTLTPGIILKNLGKYFHCGLFKSCRVDAVRGVSISIYKNEITALLGHNGAGKTTTFSILSGLTAPSSGTVSINDKDVGSNLDEIRSDLGVCPQENMMFPDFTVREQLQFVSRLKRKNETTEQLEDELDNLLTKLGLDEKRDVMPDKLSGGQKRRLCLGMALIGHASTLFLDEPTSGMDPETSRKIWDIILEYRKQKTIILTTHSMEEADVLGDRIAIMQSGKVKCYGTPMFLKKYYGDNFHEVTLSITSPCNKTKIESEFGSKLPDTRTEDTRTEDTSTEDTTHNGRIVIRIPLSDSLPERLDKIESRKADLGITGVSVSTISLGEVFLRSMKKEETEKNEKSKDVVDGKEKLISKTQCARKYLTEMEHTRKMIVALLKKKVIYFTRNWHLFLTMIIGVLLAIVLPLSFNVDFSNRTNSYLLDLSTYINAEVLIHSKNETLGETYKKIVKDQNAIGILTDTRTSLSADLLSIAVKSLTRYESRMIISSEFNSSLSANGLYSGKATFSAPIAVNTMSNFKLKTAAGDQYSIVAKIGDLPQSLTKSAKSKPQIRIGILKVVCLFALIFFDVVALFVKHPLLENSTKVKQLQQMAGVSSFMYWGTTFVIDYAFYMLLTVLSVFSIFLIDSFSQSPMTIGEVGVLFLLFSLFGINALLLAYIASFMNSRFHVVISLLSGVPSLLAFIFIFANEIMSCTEQNKSGNLIRQLIHLLPHVSFLSGFIRFKEIILENARCRGLPNILNEIACDIGNSKSGELKSTCCGMECRDGYCKNPLPHLGNFHENCGIEEFLLYLIITPILLVGILYVLEKQVLAKLCLKMKTNKQRRESHDRNEDAEVEKEESIVSKEINERVSASDSDFNEENVFLVHRLKKSYGKVEAVKKVSFRVKKKECFGLLGVNGAGKSTTFRMLVGEEFPSSGILQRGRYRIKSNRKEYLAEMGYCPQNDALIPCFNAEDHLSLLARLRGVPESEVEGEVRSWINKLQLTKYANKPSGTYSGGNKRRLNIAMALIGSPEMVLLDEPTTGVDPAARRSVWTVLQSCQRAGQSIILTSHSMEECEILCDRLVIMVQGRLLCVGASQELKERFGAGFNITMKLNPGRKDRDFKEIKEKMEDPKNFDCNLIDEHPSYLFYHVTDSKTTWVRMFEILNRLKSDYNCIEDFTVSSSTLEQLFMKFAKSAKSTKTSHDPSPSIA